MDSYSFSNPWLVNVNVRLFSVTVRTTASGAPRDFRCDLQSHLDVGTDQTREVGYDLICYAALVGSEGVGVPPG
ncbi:MAG: hypothetical protein ACYCT3_11860 [Acidiferrobacter sp.]